MALVGKYIFCMFHAYLALNLTISDRLDGYKLTKQKKLNAKINLRFEQKDIN